MEVTIGTDVFVIGELTPRDAMQVGRKLLPLLPAMAPAMAALQSENVQELVHSASALAPFTAFLSDMSDERFDQIADACLSAVRRQDGGTWVPIMAPNGYPMAKLDMATQLQLIWHVVQKNIIPFSPAQP